MPNLIPLYMTGILDVKRYALVMGQRAGPRTEADSDDEILPPPPLRDEVDDLVAAWRSQRPDLDVEPMQVLSRISRLAAADLVRREPDPRDKRGVLVTLTDRGQAQVDAALAGLLRRERVLLAGLDTGERQHLADLMRILLAPFDDAFRAPPLGSPPGRL